tara:strand:+ start:37 stop:972 length:936 start_codon:yes stop_codon:yes gene_type:complete
MAKFVLPRIIPPRKPVRGPLYRRTKRKGSNILDAAMTSEFKTDLAPYATAPLERLGVNMIANAKKGEGTTTPIKDLYGVSGGVLGSFDPETKNIKYSAGHDPNSFFIKKGEALKGTVNKQTGKISRLKDQPNLPKWVERVAGKQKDTVVHEGVHKAINALREDHSIPGSWVTDHRIIQTMGLKKPGLPTSTAKDAEPGESDTVFMKAVPREVTDFLKQFNVAKRNERISGDREHLDRVTQKDTALTSEVNVLASKKLKERGEEDPSTFVDHSKELTKSVEKRNALTDMRRILQKNSLAKPIVTARKINWAT